jgi:hypothetical protein
MHLTSKVIDMNINFSIAHNSSKSLINYQVNINAAHEAASEVILLINADHQNNSKKFKFLAIQTQNN